MIEAVRRATAADVPYLRGLADSARAAAAVERGGPEWLAEHPTPGPVEWERRVTGGLVFVASLDEVPVGALTAELDGPTLRIGGIYVEPEARELGLGEALLQAALDAARDQGANAAESIALPGDRPTKNLYERFGMKARLLVVRRSLADGD